ncbi:hypothetical protein LCY76_22775 [Fictibacillus sp. KIGAM418]|uniref:Uncharacterized protein n=1 Tax=Fictibacillus marinisediminis TaxID=2878389 RepID=A0A9X1XGC1_9BACL|nr:hypothetical protein [Fictibacillus marinisediminis]MCK6259400.1 hypothetical protein [Fictibacillus marinisediminis]
MRLMGRRKEEDEFSFETSDLLIVFDDEKKTSDIMRVTGVNEESVMVAGFYKVPVGDCVITNGKEGRNYFYRAPSQSIRETERLARLEENMVLSQITAYRPPVPPTTMDWTKGLLFGLVFIAFIVMGISGCQK